MVATRCSLGGKGLTLEKAVSPRQQCSHEIGTWRGGGKCILGDFQELAGESQVWVGLVLVTVLLQAGGWTRDLQRAPPANTPVIL